jgi:hypothetical protein
MFAQIYTPVPNSITANTHITMVSTFTGFFFFLGTFILIDFSANLVHTPNKLLS